MRLIILALTCLPALAWAQLKVVASGPDLASLAATVGGEQVQVVALAKPGEDPHFVDARPSFLVALSQADLVLVNGLELEVGWVPPLLVGARNPKVQPGAPGYFDASTAVPSKLQVPASVDRSHGDVHAGGNPHYLFDPRAAAQVVLALAERLALLDPPHGAAYRARAQALSEELRGFAAERRGQFAKLPAEKRQIVTYHRSFTYLLDWLDLRAPIEVEPRPGIPPTPAHTARVVKQMRAGGISAVLQETYYPRNASETIARLAGGRLLVVPAQTDFDGGQSYLAHIKAISGTVYDALAR